MKTQLLLHTLLTLGGIGLLPGAGELDPSFSQDGIAVSSLGTFFDGCYGIGVQSTGKIVAAGRTEQIVQGSGTGYKVCAVMRFQGDGTRDLAFGSSNGLVAPPFSTMGSTGTCVLVYPDDRFLVGGDSGAKLAVARFLKDGQPDPSFSSGGKRVSTAGSREGVEDMLFQSEGRILVAGSALSSGVSLERYLDNGALDESFGTGGRLVIALGVAHQFEANLAALPEDRFLVARAARTAESNSAYDFVVSRRNADGSPDTSFGTEGYARTGRIAGFCGVTGLAVQEDGEIVLGGHLHDGTGERFAVARFDADGRLDTAFGDQGIVITQPGYTARATALSLQESGRILLAGWSSLSAGSANHFTMVRYLPDGGVDPAFGSGGQVVTKIGNGSGTCQDIAIQGDGRILLGGASGGFAVLRYSGNGAISYQAWATAAGLEGVDAQPDGTPQADGVANLLKYAFNLDGARPDRRVLEAGGTAGLPRFDAVPGHQGSTLRVEFLRRKESTLSYLPKISANLEADSFIPMNGIPQVSEIDALWERVAVEHVFAGEPPAQAFGVVEVTNAPE